MPSSTNKVLSMDLYETPELAVPNKILTQFLPEVLTMLGSLAYLFNLLYKTYRIRRVTKTFRPLFRDAWNIIDVLMLITLGITYFLRTSFYMDPVRSTWNVQNVEGFPFVMSRLAGQYNFIFIFDASTVLVLVVKALKYFALQKDLMLLQKTLVQAISDLFTFIIILVFLFLGFIIMGHNIFGMQATGFKTIQDTIGTLFLILLGEFDYEEMRAVHDVWALIFFLFFVIFMFFIVLNIFLAILNDAYTVVHLSLIHI